MTSIPLPEFVDADIPRGGNTRPNLMEFARRTRLAYHEPAVLILDPRARRDVTTESYNGHGQPIVTVHPDTTPLPEADLIIHLK